MRSGLKFIFAILSLGSCALTGQARSADSETVNISEMIELTLKRAEKKSDDCKSARRSVSNKCGQTYIHPVISNHPDNNVATIINSFIENLEHKNSANYSRMESWTETTLNQHNLLSLSYTGQLYGRAAYGDQTVRVCSNLDLVTGKSITIDQVLKKGYQEELPAIIFENLDAGLKFKLPGYMRNLLREKGSGWKLAASQTFFLNEQDFTLCFDHGALNTETVGPLTLPLPFGLISNLIDDNGPLAFMLKESGQPADAPPQPSEAIESAAILVADPKPNRPSIPATLEASAEGIGFVEHTCFRDSVTHTIKVVEYETDSPFICIVEYDKEYEQKVLWRSRKTKAFCHESVEKLVAKYENKWDYTCGRRSTLPES